MKLNLWLAGVILFGANSGFATNKKYLDCDVTDVNSSQVIQTVRLARTETVEFDHYMGNLHLRGIISLGKDKMDGIGWHTYSFPRKFEVKIYQVRKIMGFAKNKSGLTVSIPQHLGLLARASTEDSVRSQPTLVDTGLKINVSHQVNDYSFEVKCRKI